MGTDARASGLVKLNDKGVWVRWAYPLSNKGATIELADVQLDKLSAERQDKLSGIIRDEFGTIIEVKD